MFSTPDLLMRLWVLITGLAGLGASIGAYLKPQSPHDTLYRHTKETATAPFSRMYATWLLTSTAVRIAFFVAPQCGPGDAIFWVAFATYVIALWHFGLEIIVFQTAALKPGGVAPLVVASFSVVWFAAVAFGVL